MCVVMGNCMGRHYTRGDKIPRRLCVVSAVAIDGSLSQAHGTYTLAIYTIEVSLASTCSLINIVVYRIWYLCC